MMAQEHVGWSSCLTLESSSRCFATIMALGIFPRCELAPWPARVPMPFQNNSTNGTTENSRNRIKSKGGKPSFYIKTLRPIFCSQKLQRLSSNRNWKMVFCKYIQILTRLVPFVLASKCKNPIRTLLSWSKTSVLTKTFLPARWHYSKSKTFHTSNQLSIPFFSR